jgi:hypothetical protein
MPFAFLCHNRSNLVEDEINRSIEDIEQRLPCRRVDDEYPIVELVGFGFVVKRA